MSPTKPQPHFPRGKRSNTLQSLFGYSSAMSALVWTLLLVCIVANPGVHAAVSVKGAVCIANLKEWCTNSTMTLMGEELESVASVRVGATAAEQQQVHCEINYKSSDTILCTLTMALSAKAGPYLLTLVIPGTAGADDSEVPAGNVLLGAFWGTSYTSFWNPSTTSSVTNQSSNWPSTGDGWTLHGNFDEDKTYTLFFFSSEAKAVAGNPSMVTCASVTHTTSTLTCTIIAVNGVMGMYRVLVTESETNAVLLGTTLLPSIAVNPPLPDVVGASGDCAASSAECVTGAKLILQGINFNYRKAEYQEFFVGVTEAQRNAISLTPVEVDKNGVTTTLTVADGTPAGSYPVFVRLQVCMMGMMSPLRHVGNLVLKSGDIAGFNMDMPTGSYRETQSASIPPGQAAAIILAAILGVLFLAALVALTVVCARRAARRRRSGEVNEFSENVEIGLPAAAVRPGKEVGTEGSRFSQY
ncbi:hypothetical protein JIQ42_01907 [Leishmania sp. Namibia]|uniref:hypothetical protein n=1 Tax=Leishmania sp. Namibia TaxID=2802991 RepID=UPI001B5A8063|nr:hypothetical protein JIQ42_01907 [Leishmania sp. Namibia]